MTYRILAAALADLAEIDNYVLAEFGEAAANKASERLFDAFEHLAEFQQMGRLRRDVTPLRTRFFHLEPCWIIYSEGSPLLIHRVVHGSRDLPRLTF
jgi:plasmid stabilization system protein ParE